MMRNSGLVPLKIIIKFSKRSPKLITNLSTFNFLHVKARIHPGRMGNPLKQKQKFNIFKLHFNPNYKFSRNFNNKNQEGTTVESSIAEEVLFKPKTKLNFVNGRAEVYNYTSHNVSKIALFSALAVFGFICFYSCRKLYRFRERSWLGVIIYGFLAIYFFLKMHSAYFTFSYIAKSIALDIEGKHVFMKYSKLVLFDVESKFRISQIQRPVKVEDVFYLTNFGFPVLFNGQMYLLAREAEINKEVLPAILNGQYIDTKNTNSDFQDEIKM
jgi:hypothetical protein